MVSSSLGPLHAVSVNGAVPEDAERELDSVLHAELVFRGPLCEGLEEVAIEVEAVEYDEAATRGDLGGHHAGIYRSDPCGGCSQSRAGLALTCPPTLVHSGCGPRADRYSFGVMSARELHHHDSSTLPACLMNSAIRILSWKSGGTVAPGIVYQTSYHERSLYGLPGVRIFWSTLPLPGES